MNQKKISLSSLSAYRSEIYGLSILWIMLFHSCICKIKPTPMFRWISIGNMGVEVFLFLSGTGLYYSYSKDRRILDFYKRRILRIYLPVLIICTPYWIYQYLTTDRSAGILLLKYCLADFWVRGRQQIWFLSLIAVCYFLYPFLFMILFGKKGDRTSFIWTKAVILCMITIALTWSISRLQPEFYALTEIALTRFPVFILGCAMGKEVHDRKERSLFWIPFLTVIMILSCHLILSGQVHGPVKRYTYLFGGIPVTLLSAALFKWLDRTGFSLLLPFFRFFGGISLECYLVHIIVINLYLAGIPFPYVEGSVIRYAGVLAVSIMMAYPAGKICEKISSLIKSENKSIKSGIQP